MPAARLADLSAGGSGRLRPCGLACGFTGAAAGSRSWCCCTAFVWSNEDLDRAQAAARRQPAWFASRDEAAARYLRISGLAGLLPAGDPAVDAGLYEQDGRWRLAMDAGTFAVGAPDMTELLARSQAPVTLARGEHDPMNTDEQLARLGAATFTLRGLGHNAHVQSPELSIALLDAHR